MSLAPLISKTKAQLAAITDDSTDADKTYMEDNVHQYLVDITSALQTERRNILDYGAVGDGVADDSSAIQAAIDSLSGDGGIIFFPVGTYKIGTSIKLRDHITLQGSGFNTPDGTIIKPDSAIDCLVFGDGTTNVRGARVFNMRLEGNGGGTNGMIFEGVAAPATPSRKCLIQDVGIANFSGAGIKFTEWAFSNLFVKCEIAGNGRGIHGLNRVNDTTFFECDIESSTNQGALFDGTESGVRFLECQFDGNLGGDIEWLCTVGTLNVVGGHFERVNGTSIKKTGSTLMKIDGAVFIGNAASSASLIGIQAGSNSIIIGNDFVDGATNAFQTAQIQLESGAEDCVVLGNRDGSTATHINDLGATRSLIHDTENNRFSFGIASTGETLLISLPSGNTSIGIDGVAATSRQLVFKTADSLRWIFRCNADAESGGNAGSNFEIRARTDAGGDGGVPIAINRSTGNVTLSAEIEINGNLNHDGSNVGFYGTAPVAQQTGVAVSAAGIHAALVNLGLITA